MKYFVLFKLQKGQIKHAYSVVTAEMLKTIPEDIIEAKKEIPDIEIPTKDQLKAWVIELGGNWYGNN